MKLLCGRLLLPLILMMGLLGWPDISAGLDSHEVLLLVNENSARSMEVANHFAHIRRVPPRNIVYLNLPDRVLEPAAEFTPTEFDQYIWTPAQKVVSTRELTNQILAWVYSVDFPVRITTDPPVSITGLTFLRNQLPADRNEIYRGRYLSPLYAGPDPDGRATPGASFIRYRESLEGRMPLPAMLLGFCGARGNTVDEVLQTIQYGHLADRSSPAGTIYWITGTDIRAEMRNWQFPQVLEEVQAANVRADVSDEAPVNLPGIMGLQMGRATVRTDRSGRHLPGSMAEHATSHAAEFHLPIQTKITDWIRAGATGSAGTVTEPYAVWTKFPHARFFGHYVRGLSMIESFYLSLRSPAQTLLLGEPLTRPWATPLGMTLLALEESPISGNATFIIMLMPEMPPGFFDYRLSVNGQQMAETSPMNRLSFDTNELPDGYNEIRAISYARTPIVHTTMNELGFLVDNHGRGIHLLSPASDEVLPGDQPVTLTWSATGSPHTVQVWHNHRALAEAPAEANGIEIHPAQLGAGPVRLQVRAVYEDEMIVASTPHWITIQRHNQLPPTSEDWISWIGAESRVSGGTLDRQDEGAYVFSPSSSERSIDWAILDEPASEWTRAGLRLAIPGGGHEHATDEIAGFMFDQQDENHYRFFALYGSPSAWSFGEVINGRLHHRVQRGAPLLRGTSHDIELLYENNVVTAYVNGQRIADWSLPHRPSGHLGLMVGNRTAAFHSVRYQTPTDEDSEP